MYAYLCNAQILEVLGHCKNSEVSSSISHFCLLIPPLQIIIINMHFKPKFILEVQNSLTLSLHSLRRNKLPF